MAGVMKALVEAELVVAGGFVQETGVLLEQCDAEPQGTQGCGDMATVPATANDGEVVWHAVSYWSGGFTRKQRRQGRIARLTSAGCGANRSAFRATQLALPPHCRRWVCHVVNLGQAAEEVGEVRLRRPQQYSTRRRPGCGGCDGCLRWSGADRG